MGVLFILKDLRLLGLLPVVAALFFAFAPDSVTNRMVSMFDLRDPSNRDRLAMARTGAAMVHDFPLMGVGPAMIPKLYTQYRDPDAVQAMNPHLHNVPLQIAAERGLPALVIWVAFVAALAYALSVFSGLRESPPWPPPASRPSPACCPPVSSSTTSATPSS